MAEPTPQLPLFFREIAVLDANRHGELRLDRGRNFGFARDTNAVPVALVEATAASSDYPLVFGPAAQPALLAVLGYRDRGNLYVDAAGQWRRDTYIPAYVRNYPFAIIEQAPQGLVLGFDPKAQAIGGKTGAPLFADGQPTAALNEAADLCRTLYRSLRDSVMLARALEEKGLLIEHSAVIEFKQGGSAVLRGFRVVDQAKFAVLDDATFLEWRRRGWLPAIYASLNSAPRWAKLVDLASMSRA